MLQDRALTTGAVSRLSEKGMTRMRSLLIAAVLMGAMALLAPNGDVQLGLGVSSVTLLILGVLMVAFTHRRQTTRESAQDVIADFIAKDASPSFVVR